MQEPDGVAFFLSFTGKRGLGLWFPETMWRGVTIAEVWVQGFKLESCIISRIQEEHQQHYHQAGNPTSQKAGCFRISLRIMVSFFKRNAASHRLLGQVLPTAPAGLSGT